MQWRANLAKERSWKYSEWQNRKRETSHDNPEANSRLFYAGFEQYYTYARQANANRSANSQHEACGP